jgi:2-methylcitrate dehydratase PrpD
MPVLSDYISKALKQDLAQEVLIKAKFHFLDTVASMISGSQMLAGQKAIDFVKAQGEVSGGSTVLGTNLKTTAIHAALANGMFGHADETDDSHAESLTHPGCGIVAAVLSSAEHFERNGLDMLKAMVLGYDVCCRLTKSLHAYDFRVQGHSSHTFGPNFGAAAAAGALASVNSEQARYLMSYAAQQASGVSSWMRDKDHIEKAFDFGGMAARNGVTSAIMVSLGFTGVDDVFSGERNFYVAYGKDPIVMELATDLGTRYEIMQTSIKRWTVGSPIQAPLDSLDILIRNHNFELSDISHIKVIIPHESLTIVNNREMPEICIQHLCALMLIDGNMNFAKAHDRLRMRDPEVLRIRELIELSASDELSKQMPTRQGIVEIHLKNGKTLREYTQAVRGTPLNPMSQEELDHKCIELMAPVLGKSTASAICEAVWELERFKSAREFTQILRKH